MFNKTAQTRTVRRGFTLTEILVAVGVLLAVVVTAMATQTSAQQL